MTTESTEKKAWGKKKYLYLDKFEKHVSDDSIWKTAMRVVVKNQYKIIAAVAALALTALVIAVFALIKVNV